MQVVVATEYRFLQDGNGAVYSENGTRSYAFWSRYLEVFDSVIVLGRLGLGGGPGMAQAEGPNVSVYPLPCYVGPRQYLLRLPELKQRIRQVCLEDAAFIARCPGAVADLMVKELLVLSKPYGIEVVGNPYDVFGPGVIRHPLRPLLRRCSDKRLKRWCDGACGAMYVTEHTLQQRYPCPGLMVGVSDANLSDDAIASAPRSARGVDGPITLLYVGTLEQLYKGQDVLIQAVGDCVKEGLNLRLAIVGDGRHRSRLEAQAKRLGLDENVVFLGQLAAGEQIRAELDRADVFVLPSLTEGLPRAMIEAMARALPCIGSAVGGIPELLSVDDMVTAGDAAALARKIRDVVNDPDRMLKMSARNLNKAKEYREEALHEQRVQFYRFVRERTEDWMRSRVQ